MANRYWVGGTDNWNGTAASKWATTSGGTGGASVPTTSDNVFFDGNSGSGTITISSGNTGAAAIDCTGFTGTIAGSTNMQVNGSITLVSGMGFTYSGTFTLAGAGTKNFTSGGKTFAGSIVVNGGSSTIQQQDAVVMSGGLQLTNGSWTTNNNALTSSSFIAASNSNTRVLTLGSSLYTITGNAGNIFANQATGGFTFSAGTSTVKFTSTTANAKTIQGGGVTFYNLWITGSGAATYTITGANTYNEFKDDKSVAHTLVMPAGVTQTVTTWTVNGSVGTPITIQSSSAGSQWTLSKSSGTVTSDYVSLQDSVATGGATFNATHAVNAGNNSGWNFIGGNSGFFGMM